MRGEGHVHTSNDEARKSTTNLRMVHLLPSPLFTHRLPPPMHLLYGRGHSEPRLHQTRVGRARLQTRCKTTGHNFGVFRFMALGGTAAVFRWLGYGFLMVGPPCLRQRAVRASRQLEPHIPSQPIFSIDCSDHHCAACCVVTSSLW